MKYRLDHLALFFRMTVFGKVIVANMYVENKDGLIDDFAAHIGWVTFSKTGKTVYYQDKVLSRIKRGGIAGNHVDEETGEEYWLSGIKKRGSDTHWAEPTNVKIDDDAREEYERLLSL